jgi:lauroyl/myristoyl acyltransferase
MPIVVGAFLRDGLFRYRMIAEPPIRFTPTGDKDKDIETLLTEMNQRLGNLVRRYPEQYLWSHKRWR